MKRNKCERWPQGVCSFILIILLSLIVVLDAPPSISAAEKTIILKLSSFLPEAGTEGQLGKWWGTEVDKRTNGRVEVQYFFAESLVKTMDSLPAVSSGIADVQFFAAGYFPSQLPLSGGPDLIYQTRSNWVFAKAYNEMGETFPPYQKMFKDNNILLMSSWPASEVVIISSKPIRTLADLKGKKIRAMGLMNVAMKMLGATPVAMPLPEVYEALERGTIDFVTGIPYHLVVSFKLHEAAKYLINPSIGCYASGGYFMNLKTWNNLPDDIKKIIKKINEEFPDVGANMSNEILKKTTDTLLKAKVDIYSLPPEEVAKWKAVLVPHIYDDWVKQMEAKGLPGKETLAKYQELVKKYEKNDKYVSPYPKQ
jgi:TRAP-type C4-dicarboxylate transport system substrate-binding protein